MKKKSLVRLSVAALLSLASGASFASDSDPKGYIAIPNAKERSKPTSGYTVFPNMPNLELVKEGDGTPNPVWAKYVQDPNIKKKIEDGYYESLQVRNLGLKTGEVRYSADRNTLVVPIAVSVKHTQGRGASAFVNQGTIEGLGEIKLNNDGTNLSASLVNFYDSQAPEVYGRKLGANADIDLDFARAVAIPVLQGFFSADHPENLPILLQLVGATVSTDVNKP